MIIDNADILKAWLTANLRPLCDADPAALAKYVLALLRKDKSDPELKQGMLDQLEVFLQQDTVTFVDKLFETLETKGYLSFTEEPSEIKTEPNIADSSDGSQGDTLSTGHSTEPHPISVPDPLPLPMDTSAPNGDLEKLDEYEITPQMSTSNPLISPEEAISCDPKIRSTSSSRKDRVDRDNKTRRKSRSPVLRRSRSRSRERNRRGFSPKGHYRGRPGMRRSPDRRHSRDVWDRLDRRRSPGARNRSPSPRVRSRTPPRYRRNYDANRGRSRSPMNRNRDRSPIRINHRTGEVLESKVGVQSTVVKVSESSGRTDNNSESKNGEFNGSNANGNRCKDFDERGLCMRGELCPYDHGTNPVVLQDVGTVGLKRGVQITEPGIPSPFGGVESPDYRMMRPTRPILGMDATMLEQMPWGQMSPFSPGGQRGRGGMMIRSPHPYPMLPQRELINIPVMGSSPPMNGMGMEHEMPYPPGMHPMGMFHPRGIHPSRGRGRGRGGFDHSRLGNKPRNYTNCSLEVRRIPKGLNTISDLNGHFVQFGKIVNIQINFENDPEAALITFSTPAEALASYKSTEAVLNNRFIRVFWHKKEKENEEAATELGGARLVLKERLGESDGETGEEVKPIEGAESEKILMTGNTLVKTVYNANAQKKEISAEKVQAVEAIKKSQEQLAAQEMLKKANQEKKKEAMKLLSDLQKKRQSMLVEQIEQQKKLISKFEAGKSTMKPEEKEELMKLIKSLQESIETLKA